MKYPLFLIFIISSLLFATSCSNKKMTSTKIKIFASNLSTANPGGIMLYGENSADGLKFAQPISDLSTEKQLSNGNWSFYAMMWSGATPLAGTIKCAKPTTYLLKGQDIEISMVLTQANCNDQLFVKPGAFTSSLFELSVSLCPSNITQAALEAATNCTGYAGMATGLKVRMMGRDLGGGFFPTDQVSSCTSISSGYANTNLQIASGDIPQFLGATQFEVYYSPTYPSCSAEGCCSGRRDDYLFPNGFNNPTLKPDEASLTATNGNYLYLKEHTASMKLKFTGSVISTGAQYRACNEATVELQDPSGTPLVSSEAITLTPTCNGKCDFYADNACNVNASTYTIANASSSQSVYFKPHGPTMNLMNAGAGDKYTGDFKTITVHTTWANIDSEFLWSEASLAAIPNAIWAGVPTMAVNKIWIYETRSGNRGALKFNSITTTTDPNDTVNFDFTTWDSSGAVVGTNVSVSSVACFSGSNCFWEFDNNVGSGANSGSIEAWWENLSGSLYLNPQASIPIISLP